MNAHGSSVRVIAWITAVCLLGDSMLYIVLPVYWQHYGLDALWQVGVLLSVNRFVRLPLGPLIGWLYSRLPKRTGVLAAVALACATTLAFGFFSGFALLLAARALWGAAWSMLRIGGYLTVLEASSGGDRGQLLGRYNGIIGIGSLVGMLAGGLLADLLGVRAVALLLGAVMLAGLPFTWRFVPSTVTPSAPPRTDASVPRLTAATLLPLLSGFTTALVFFGLLMSALSPLIATRLPDGGTLTLAGFTLGAASVAGVLQALRWGWSPFLSPWFGRQSDGPRGRLPLYLAALSLSATAFALLALPLPFGLWLAALLAVMLANTAITTLSDTLAADAAAGSRAVAYMTTYTIVVDVGAALGPLASFVLLGAFGPGGVGFACAALMAFTAAAWLIFHRKRRML
ncbi:Predicted arabinose efflux permease, MFS family [Paenibacillus tianmuensis]|uniref:Predicted arabinose efflux permease, MFS family n=1 Tax=Paenibacillus tianmuensis TaxID=624147 RepID=A0A1G4TYV6_9BACL|nr:MFS transporter [Paenibacillus tianmuensis]SCW86517.1 Predicted arabinose efflux permease, MFS family [Paenibacillus tianmuensis]